MIVASILTLLSLRFFYLFFTHKIFYYINGRLLWFLVVGWAILLAAAGSFLFHRGKSKSQLIYVLLLLLIILPVQALDPTHSLTVKPANDSQLTTLNLPADTSGYSFSDWYRYRESGSPKQELTGKTFSTSGFLDSYDAASKTLELGRLVITCCIADAFKVSFPVELGALSASGLTSGQWYSVTGHWQENSAGEWVVTADHISLVDVPNDPYVYP